MIIYPSKVSKNLQFCRIEAEFESGGDRQILFYEFPAKYSDFLVTENLDAFFVGLLLLALKRGEDIEIKGRVSEKLYYNVTTYLIPTLTSVDNNYKSIHVNCAELNPEALKSVKAVGTGVSCGVDSLSTIFTHSEGAKAVDFLAFFNAGSHGYWGDIETDRIFLKRLKAAESFSEKFGKPLISVQTNISEILKIEFQSSHSIRNLSCILNLQKLLGTYLYASAFGLESFQPNKKDTSTWDIYLIKLLETETITFVASMIPYSRHERIEILSKNPLAHQFLDVCINPTNSEKTNCSKCYKCLRTQLSLELIGQLKYFGGVFNIHTFLENRERFIGEIILTRKKNPFNNELFSMLRERNRIKYFHYYFSGVIFFKTALKKVKRKLEFFL